MPERLACTVYYKNERYINTFTFTFLPFYGLPTWLLSDFVPYLCHAVAAVFNASIAEGCVLAV